jgi:8-oxo-dGTP pyrophosphatase MutT (NUDIX family)
MRVHRGQIAFPGGGVEEGETVEQAALRETEEEVGVPPADVRLLGRMDDVVTRTGFLVAPLVGVLPPEYAYVSQPSEVHEIFEVPMSVLMSPGNPQIRYLDYRGEKFPSYYYIHEEREIWGLTGRILKAFLDVARLAV